MFWFLVWLAGYIATLTVWILVTIKLFNKRVVSGEQFDYTDEFVESVLQALVYSLLSWLGLFFIIVAETEG